VSEEDSELLQALFSERNSLSLLIQIAEGTAFKGVRVLKVEIFPEGKSCATFFLPFIFEFT
jgi:hypothetical protein